MRGFGFNQRQTSGWSHIDSVLGQCALGAERHVAVNQSKQGVVLAHADVVAGVEACTALTHDDGTSADQFTAEGLDTIFGLESRPFRVEPPPFFCAMTSTPY